MNRWHNKGLNIGFICIPPAYVGVKGNEEVDILAKQSLKLQTIDLQFSLSEAIIKYQTQKYDRNIGIITLK